ncbi:prolyl oligopeptidase family serine peptidase [Hallella bergensis]|uniref:S9 family peptidase n=1 Tax=Hallella bergensis TaxID=242750 RepID=UPI003990875F
MIKTVTAFQSLVSKLQRGAGMWRKRISVRSLTVGMCLLGSFPLFAQKKPLDHDVYDGWQRIATPALSPDGTFLSYQINPQEGDGTLYIRNNKRKKTIAVARGYKAQLTDKGLYAVCLVKPLFQQTRQAKIKKKKADDMPMDSLAIINLQTGNIKRFAHVRSYELGKYADRAVAFSVKDTTLIPKKDRKKKDVGYPTLIYHFATGKTDTLRHVDRYAMNKQGTALAYVSQYKKNNTTLRAYDISSGKSVLIGDTLAYYSLPKFNESGTQMLYLQSADTLSSGSKHCSLHRYTIGQDGAEKLAEPTPGGCPDGWGINENSQPTFSQNGKDIFVGIAPYIAPDDTTLHSFETASLDIWNWDAPMLPPAEKANLKALKKKNCLTVYNNGRLIPMTTSMYDRIRIIDRGNADYVLSLDRTGNMVETQWSYQTLVNVSLVELSTGKRIPIVKGQVTNVTASPSGRYVAWFDLTSSQWMTYDVATGTTRNLTTGMKVNFWDEEDDHPMLKEPYGEAGWTAGDRDLLVYDQYDLWRIPMNGGKPVCLTKGRGRENNRVYRFLNLKDSDDPIAIAPSETMLLTVFDKISKKNGFSKTNLSGNLKDLTLEGWAQSVIRKARNSNTYAYLRGNFDHPNDLYVTTNDFATQQKLTSINPQQEDYNWGTVELVHWNAFDGTLLDGLLYKPEDFDASKKYPVMIYFYEKNSDGLYKYIEPQPSWSIINIAFYTSRGYLVFVPDIVYKAGVPGESAYNCIVSGAQQLARKPWVDAGNMAIQGQSWGGYQVAYLITRTNMFKAAGAGAPVSNMTSAFGGIRWGSGNSRQGQYEEGQSRIGHNLWEAPELYISNSALFKLPNVETPVLIMHNDADGAVPWYQGIEMFMGLRRLGKPAWLLQYNKEEHNLKERRNRKDLSIRLQQFFDYELKGAPQPAWMKTGLPILRKGQYYGYEKAE